MVISTLARGVVHRARWIVAIVLAISAWLSTGLSYSETRPVLEGELPDSDWIVRDTDAFSASHPDRNYSAIGIEAPGPEGIWNPVTLAKVVALSEDAAALPGALANVQSLSTWDHVVAGEDTIEVRPLMPEAPKRPAEIAVLRETVSRDRLLVGRLVSPDGKMALVRVAFQESTDEAVVHAGLESLRQRYEGPEHIAIFGVDHNNHEIDLATSSHLSLLLPLAVALLLLFFWLSFGRMQAVWITASLIALSINDFLGLMGVLEIPRSVLSSVVPLLLVVVLGSYAVHLLMRVYEEAAERPWPDAVETALRRTSPPIALAALTTSLGFATLAVFDILSVREFGILCAGGILIGGLLALTWVPALLVVSARGAPRPIERGRRWFARGARALTERAARATLARSRWIDAGFAAIVVIALVGSTLIRVGSNPPEFFPRGHPVREGFESLLEHFGGDGFFFLQISAPDGSDILEPDFLHRVEATQRDIRREPTVGFATSVTDTVLARMNRSLNGDDPAFEKLPEDRASAAQYLEVYRWDAADTLAEMVENSDRPRHLIVDIFADVNDSARVTELVEATKRSLERHFPTPEQGTAIFGGESALWSAQNRYVVRGKVLSLASAMVLVGVVCWLVLGERRTAALAVVPTAFAALVVFGSMGIANIRLDLASCVITSIVVGIGVDFALHYLFRFREVVARFPEERSGAAAARAIRLSGPPILYDVASNVIAFGIFLASPLVPIRQFGALICVSMFACAAATLLLLPRWAAARAFREDASTLEGRQVEPLPRIT